MDECTICTARAPEAVFTVRTYGDTRPLYDPHLVPTCQPEQHCRSSSQRYKINNSLDVSQVGSVRRQHRRPDAVDLAHFYAGLLGMEVTYAGREAA